MSTTQPLDNKLSIKDPVNVVSDSEILYLSRGDIKFKLNLDTTKAEDFMLGISHFDVTSASFPDFKEHITLDHESMSVVFNYLFNLATKKGKPE